MRKDSSGPRRPGRGNKPTRHWRGRQLLTALLFLGPSLAGVVVFVLVPFLGTVRRSFFTAIGNSFVGLDNYRSVLANSGFHIAAANTARFIAVCIPLLLLLSLVVAVLVRRIGSADTRKVGGRAGATYKTIYLATMAIPVAGVVLLWRALFHQQGLANHLLTALGAQPVGFMSTDAAFWVLIGTYLWKNCGYDMVLWLADFDNINPNLYEAARVDGAGEWRCFRHVTLPGLLPTLFLIAVLSLINSFKVFREAYLVGGPYPESTSIYLLQHLFNNWFSQLDVSRLCAAAVLLAIVLLGAILLLERLWGKERLS